MHSLIANEPSIANELYAKLISSIEVLAERPRPKIAAPPSFIWFQASSSFFKELLVALNNQSDRK